MFNKRILFKNNITSYSFLFISVISFLRFSECWAKDTLTMEDVLSIGLKNNFDISIQRMESQKSTNNLVLGTGYLLPQINASNSVNFSKTNDLNDNRNLLNPRIQQQQGGDFKTSSITAGINGNWTLFDGLRMFRGRKLLKVFADLGQVQQQVKIENIVVQIIKSFCNVVLQQKLVDIAHEQVIISKQRLEREQSRSDMGRSKKREFLNAKVILNNDKSFLGQQKLLLKQSQNNLNVLLGRNPNETITVYPNIDLPENEYTFKDIENKTFDRNSTLKILELRQQTSELNLKVNRAALSPMLIASGSYSYSNITNEFDKVNYTSETERSVPSIGLSLQWNLLNGFSKEVGIKNAKLDLRKSQLEIEKYKLQLKALIQQKWDNLEYSYNQVEFEREAMELAKKNVEISNDMFALGKLTGVAFREAQLSYQNSAMRYQNSIVKARISLVELEQLAGVIRIE